jgi:hypothetical protein
LSRDIYNCYLQLGAYFGVRFFQKEFNPEDHEEAEIPSILEDLSILRKIKGITCCVYHDPEKEKSRKNLVDLMLKVGNRKDFLESSYLKSRDMFSDILDFSHRLRVEKSMSCVSLKQLMFFYNKDKSPQSLPVLD